jgi:hypothetical protein
MNILFIFILSSFHSSFLLLFEGVYVLKHSHDSNLPLSRHDFVTDCFMLILVHQLFVKAKAKAVPLHAT